MGIIGSLVLLKMRNKTQHAGCAVRIATIVCCEPVEDLHSFRCNKSASVETVKGIEKIRKFDRAKGIQYPLVQPGRSLVKRMV